MAFNSNYTGEQIEEGIKKSLEALDLNGASVNVEMVDETTPASGTVTKEEGSNRARFDFKIPMRIPEKFTDIKDNIILTSAGKYHYSSGDDYIEFNIMPQSRYEVVEIYGVDGDNYVSFPKAISVYGILESTHDLVKTIGYSIAHIIVFLENGIPYACFINSGNWRIEERS